MMRIILCLLLVGWTCGTEAKKKEMRSVVRLETTVGVIRVALSDDTPRHRDNFLELVEKHYYDSTLFHRVIRDFMIQGGDPDSRNAPAGKSLGDGGPGYTLAPEFCLPYLYHVRGALAAAREGDEVNPGRYSAGSQFYIVWGKKMDDRQLNSVQATLDELTGGEARLSPDMRMNYRQIGGAPHLDGMYTVFGEVIEGLDVVEKIQGVETGPEDRPVEDVVLLRAVVEQKSKAALAPPQKRSRRR